eukprot:gene9437-biopygen18216
MRVWHWGKAPGAVVPRTVAGEVWRSAMASGLSTELRGGPLLPALGHRTLAPFAPRPGSQDTGALCSPPRVTRHWRGRGAGCGACHQVPCHGLAM